MKKGTHYPDRRKDYIGKTFGQRIITGSSIHPKKVICRCACGQVNDVWLSMLLKGEGWMCKKCRVTRGLKRIKKYNCFVKNTAKPPIKERHNKQLQILKENLDVLYQNKEAFSLQLPRNFRAYILDAAYAFSQLRKSQILQLEQLNLGFKELFRLLEKYSQNPNDILVPQILENLYEEIDIDIVADMKDVG